MTDTHFSNGMTGQAQAEVLRHFGVTLYRVKSRPNDAMSGDGQTNQSDKSQLEAGQLEAGQLRAVQLDLHWLETVITRLLPQQSIQLQRDQDNADVVWLLPNSINAAPHDDSENASGAVPLGLAHAKRSQAKRAVWKAIRSLLRANQARSIA